MPFTDQQKRKLLPVMRRISGIFDMLKRLDKSSTTRTRHNALVAFKRAVRELAKETLETYRPIRKDGTEVPLKKKRGAFCPYCKIPFASTTALAAHLRSTHGWEACPCGKMKYNPGYAARAVAEISRHISRFPDLAVHLAKAELLAVAKERRSANGTA